MKLCCALGPARVGPAHGSQGVGQVPQLPLVFATDPLNAKLWERGQNTPTPLRAAVLRMTVPPHGLLPRDGKLATSSAAC